MPNAQFGAGTYTLVTIRLILCTERMEVVADGGDGAAVLVGDNVGYINIDDGSWYAHQGP